MTGWKDAVFLHGGMEGMERHGGFLPQNHENTKKNLVYWCCFGRLNINLVAKN